MDYFNRSQEIKNEISSKKDILDLTKQAFNEEFEPFNFGGTINIFRVGQLPSGLYLALRSFRTDMEDRNFNLQKWLMEYYCQNAEYLDSQGEGVPQVCIGIIYQQKAGILTEDLTAGGTEEFEHHDPYPYGFQGFQRKKIFVDIDGVFKSITNLKPKYFKRQNAIKLK